MDEQSLKLSAERPARTWSGYGCLALTFALLAFIVFCLVGLANEPTETWRVPSAVVGVLAFFFVVRGFYMLQPNQAAAILLFGAYRGTDRNTGLRWTWPWLVRQVISVRIYNVTSERLKVNDRRGNPIEIASNVVWRVSDTARALFDVEDYGRFVNVQIESAVRAIGSRYPYDDYEHGEKTLRSDGDHIAVELSAELQERVASAGVTVDECRLTHLAYAPEIAQAMLRRQQAQAIIAARMALVEGAVSMVEMALAQLSARKVVELDDVRRAAMVSNLMVVLCSERDTQPVLSTGANSA